MLVRDRPRLTRQAIESLALVSNEWGDMWSGEKGKPAITVLIIDDRSNQETRDYLASLPESSSFEVVRNEKEIGTGPLRNLAIEASEECFGRGEYLYLSDNDTVFLKGWLRTLVHCYEDVWSRGFRLLGGCNHPFHQPLADRQFITNDPLHIVNRVQALALQSQLMHWEVWDAFGPFVQTPVDRVCQSEDVAFANKLTEAGFKLGVVSPALIVNTGVTNSFGQKIPGWEAVLQQAPPGVIVE